MTVLVGTSAPTSGQKTDFKTTFDCLGATNPSYTGTLTGGTGVVNLGSGQLVKDAAGNIGLGVPPSAWGSTRKAYQVGLSAFVCGLPFGESVEVGSNAFNDGAGWRYILSGNTASVYQQAAGAHNWHSAPSGTAGNLISWTQAMTLGSDGRLTVPGTIRTESGLDINNSTGGTWSQYTAADGSARWYRGGDRMVLDASGNLLVGTTTTDYATHGLKYRADLGTLLVTSTDSEAFFAHRIGSTGTLVNLYCTGTAVGSISSNGTTVAYNTSSDARLKENIAAADNGSALIDGLQVRKFDWKSDGSHQRFGFVAQELDAVYPEAVSKPADPDEMMGVDYSKLVPLLVQEIQSLRARVAALETV